MGASRTMLLAAAFCFLSTLLAGVAHGAQKDTSSTAKAVDVYLKKLKSKVSIEISSDDDEGKLTVENAIELLCDKAGVPYQTELSRAFCGERLTAQIESGDYDKVVASETIAEVAAKVGVVMRIDDKGVYLFPRLTAQQRLQIGMQFRLEATASVHRQTEGRSGNRTIFQDVKVHVELMSTRSLKDIKVVIHLYASIQKNSFRSSKYDRDTRPRYGQQMEFVRIHEEEMPIAVLPRMEYRQVESELITTSYKTQAARPTYKRYGERYYGYVVDVYLADQMIKSVASLKKLHQLLERDERTGFP